ncbi:fl(2)d-associated complex component-like isoform X2 [Battus philenor]|uniref:fl(2)d-associated complex component-like isoform X2 n=1 Tax=Battus philenor TaxID=42288 RepID=UPI0035D01BB5
MSKQGKRKITVELPKTKDLANRPSVFERLGTKKTSSTSGKKTSEYCRQWAQHGSCAYGKSCKFAATHTLISPSKQRAANKESDHKRLVKDDPKSRLHSTVVVRTGRSPDEEIDNWDQNDLEYADTDVLEKRRQQLQRELELQLKMDSTKDIRKDKKKMISSSSSSRSSSSSSMSSSSSDGTTSSSSSGRDAKRKLKKGKLKRNSSSSSDGEAPSKKKISKSDSLKREKSEAKKPSVKKDDRVKKNEANRKKTLAKTTIGKKSLSPGKKSGGTPPITSKSLVTKNTVKHAKSPQRREKNRSMSPHSARDRDKERDRNKEKEREKEREKDREKDRDRARVRSRSPKKARSRSPRRHGSHSKDSRRKDSSERSRPVSPKKQIRRDGSSERHRKSSVSKERDRTRDHKDRSLERRKDKHDDKDRHDRKDRGRDRNKDVKRDDNKRRGRERGLGGRGGSDKGLEKPNKPMERLLPRPEERMAALAAISNRTLESDKNSSTSKDRQDTHSDRGGRKDRLERDRSTKRDRLDSLEREPGDYEMGLERQYDHGHSLEHYDRIDDRFEGVPREGERSPGYTLQGRERHYDSAYDMSGPPRGYPEDEERIYGETMSDHRGVDIGYDDRRPHRDHSWEGRSGSIDRERAYMHTHKDWENEDYRGPGDWGRERHWPIHDPQMPEWSEKDADMEGWRHRGHPPGSHRGRVHDDYNRGMRMDLSRSDSNKRRGPRNESETVVKETLPTVQPTVTAPAQEEAEVEDKPVPDDLSEISDDPDDILEREDMLDQNMDEDSQVEQTNEEVTSKPDGFEKESTQDTSGAGEEKESQEGKDDEDVTNLDFEEISDGELEEERTRGLGDALGVDWASLVADARRREQVPSTGGARDRWRPERVLARLGLSLHMAGESTVQNILEKNAENLQAQNAENPPNNDGEKVLVQNGQCENTVKQIPVNVNTLHPIASIQVAIEKRKHQRAVLFGSGCEITRGLSARRDLALRRYLCHLPAVERTGQSRAAPQPSLFHAARALLMQEPVSG